MPDNAFLEEGKDMSFLDHLEELRWHLIRSLVAIGVFAVIAFLSKSVIFHWVILGPSRPDFWTYTTLCKLSTLAGSSAFCFDKLNFIIQNRTMTGQFTTHLAVSFVAGLIVAFPYVFWEFWRFIKPGLYPEERKLTRGSVFFVSLLFSLGVSFGYFLVAPLSVQFLSSYTVDPTIMNEIDLRSYMGTILTLVLACGIMFQLPMVAYVLARAGIITPELMITYRRHGIVIILIISAIITPADVISQLLVSFPLIVLYQISIWIVRRTEKKRKKELGLE